LIARRPAIGGNQDLVVLTLHRTPGDAVRPDDPDARAGRARRPFFALRTRGPRRPRRTDRTSIAFGTLRSRWAWIALRAPAAGGQADEQRHRQCQMRHAHRHNSPRESRPTSPLRRSNPAVRRKANAGSYGTVCLSCNPRGLQDETANRNMTAKKFVTICALMLSFIAAAALAVSAVNAEN
jgi:hypothetical protein